VRLLLDANVSSVEVGRLLVAGGHDVGALDQEPGLDALDDEQVLELAQSDGSILVTHNSADVPSVLRDWLGAGRPHAGVILVHGVEHSLHELVAGGVERWLRQRPRQEDWVDVCVLVTRDLE
jgi:predicted nuclease of predicted toxin-antitoxin system